MLVVIFLNIACCPSFGPLDYSEFGMPSTHFTLHISISTILPNTSMAGSDTNLLTDAVYNASEMFLHGNDD